MDNGNIKYDFVYEGITYIADIRHFLELTNEEIKLHNVTEEMFLVHLFSPSGVKSFELFIEAGDISMTWKTKSDLSADAAICEIIGNKINDVHM